MAALRRSYLCEVCGQDVAVVTDSDLYLRYVLARCHWNACTASRSGTWAATRPPPSTFVDAAFSLVSVPGDFGKASLDPAFVGPKRRA